MQDYYLGIDIGGSSIKAGIVTGEGTRLAARSAPSALEHGLDEGLANLDTIVRELLEESGAQLKDLRGIGVAAPGTMDIPRGIVFHPFNLPGWENLPLRDLISKRYGRPAVLQNDANAAALGEYWLGAAHGAHSLMFWTLGTGVGGGIVIGGRVIEGAHSHAGECGHMILQMDGGPRSEFGIHGSLELYAGGRALVRRGEAALASGRVSTLRKCVAAGQSLTPLLIGQAAEEGDPLALELVCDTARYLARGTVNIMHILNPELVLIGGAMTFGQSQTALGRRFLEEVREEVKRWAFPIPATRTRIDYATLGNDAGYVGAAACARAAFGPSAAD